MSHSPKDLAPKFFSDTASTYDLVANYATLGQDRKWKSQIIEKISGKSILDLACGTGILTRMIAQKFPDSQILGIDISENYLDLAIQNSQSYTNISYQIQDAEKLNLDRKFDCIVSSYVPKYCNAKVLAQKIHEHLNPNGVAILHDFAYPKNFLVRKLWTALFALLRISGMFLPSWSFAFAELPKLIKSSNWIEQYQKELHLQGFDL
ncbi:MAG: methyltransferase domain-containing protein, partial [Candidatus Nitrosotenuis sp.]